MFHPELEAKMVRMLSPTELNLKKRKKLINLISDYVPEDLVREIIEGGTDATDTHK